MTSASSTGSATSKSEWLRNNFKKSDVLEIPGPKAELSLEIDDIFLQRYVEASGNKYQIDALVTQMFDEKLLPTAKCIKDIKHEGDMSILASHEERLIKFSCSARITITAQYGPLVTRTEDLARALLESHQKELKLQPKQTIFFKDIAPELFIKNLTIDKLKSYSFKIATLGFELCCNSKVGIIVSAGQVGVSKSNVLPALKMSDDEGLIFTLNRVKSLASSKSLTSINASPKADKDDTVIDDIL